MESFREGLGGMRKDTMGQEVASPQKERNPQQKGEEMEKNELKRILRSVGIAGLMAGGGIALTAQPAMSA